MRILAPVILGVAMPFLAMVPETSIAQEPYETTEVADGVYRFRWQAHNGLFVIGRGDAGTQALVIDPISVEAGAQLALEILSIAPDAELVGIVYSHHHADHATGAEAVAAEFGGEIPIIAHANAEAPIRSGGDPALPPPTVTFTDRATVMVSDRRVQLHYLGPNHSDNSLVAFVPDVGVAFAVDFASHDRVGYRDLPDWKFPGQFTSLARLLELDFETIVFGHGPNGDRGSIVRQIAYYDDLQFRVAAAFQAGMTENEAAEVVRSPDFAGWSQYSDWYGLNVRGMYRWLATRNK